MSTFLNVYIGPHLEIIGGDGGHEELLQRRFRCVDDDWRVWVPRNHDGVHGTILTSEPGSALGVTEIGPVEIARSLSVFVTRYGNLIEKVARTCNTSVKTQFAAVPYWD